MFAFEAGIAFDLLFISVERADYLSWGYKWEISGCNNYAKCFVDRLKVITLVDALFCCLSPFRSLSFLLLYHQVKTFQTLLEYKSWL